MVFDPSVHDLDAYKFQRQDWSQTVYFDAPPDQPPNMPMPRGQGFIVSAYVDIDHADDTAKRRSLTGFFIYCNNALFIGCPRSKNILRHHPLEVNL